MRTTGTLKGLSLAMAGSCRFYSHMILIPILAYKVSEPNRATITTILFQRQACLTVSYAKSVENLKSVASSVHFI